MCLLFVWVIQLYIIQAVLCRVSYFLFQGQQRSVLSPLRKAAAAGCVQCSDHQLRTLTYIVSLCWPAWNRLFKRPARRQDNLEMNLHSSPNPWSPQRVKTHANRMGVQQNTKVPQPLISEHISTCDGWLKSPTECFVPAAPEAKARMDSHVLGYALFGRSY